MVFLQFSPKISYNLARIPEEAEGGSLRVSVLVVFLLDRRFSILTLGNLKAKFLD